MNTSRNPHDEAELAGIELENEVVSAVFHTNARQKQEASNRGLHGSLGSEFFFLFRVLPCVPWFHLVFIRGDSWSTVFLPIKKPHADTDFAGFQLENEVVSAMFHTIAHRKQQASNRELH